MGWDWTGKLQFDPQTPLGNPSSETEIVAINHGKSVDPAGLQGSKDCLFLGAGEESEAGKDGDSHLERNQPGAFLPLNIKCQISNIPADFHASPALRMEGGFWCFKACSPPFSFKHSN